MSCYLFFKKKSFLQHPFPDIKEGIADAIRGSNALVKIPDPFCSEIDL